MADFQETHTDQIGLADPVTVNLDSASLTVTDAVGVTDTVTTAKTVTVTVTDAVGLLDTAGEFENNVETVTDAVGLTDTALVYKGLSVPSIDGATAVPGIGTLELWDPVTNPLIVEVPSIDGASSPPGVTVRTATEDSVILAAPDVYAHLYNSSGALVSTLDNQVSVEWQDPQNEVGVGTLVVNRHDYDPSLFAVGSEVRCFLYGDLVFTFLIEVPPEAEVVGDGDEVSELLTITGPGRNALCDYSLVYPAKGVDAPLNPAHRLYSFASIDYVEGAGWVNATQQYRADQLDPLRYLVREFTYAAQNGPDVVEYVPTPPPFGWPDPESYWIWGQADRMPVGYCFFRKWFTVQSETSVIFAVTADNFYTLYLDGTAILGEKTEIGCWREYKTVELTLPAGDYLLAASVENVDWPIPEDNPAGFMMTAFIPKGTTGEVKEVLCRTDSTWRAMAYPVTWPGWTPGGIIIDLIDEAQLRGEIPSLTYDFTALADSAGNPWPVTEAFSIPIGATLLDVLDSLVEQGWINYRLAPGGLSLQAFDADWEPDSGVTLQATGVEATTNLVSYSISPQTVPKTRLFVKWSSGMFQVDDAAAQATYGIRPLFITLDAATKFEAERRADFILQNVNGPRDAISAGIAPTGPGDRPYSAFTVGQRLNVPNRTATGTTSERLLALSISHDEQGNAIIGAELQTRIELLERLNEDILQQLGTGRSGSDKVRWSLYQTEPVNS